MIDLQVMLKDNITYKVEEVYNDGILTNLKTIIEAKIK